MTALASDLQREMRAQKTLGSIPHKLTYAAHLPVAGDRRNIGFLISYSGLASIVARSPTTGSHRRTLVETNLGEGNEGYRSHRCVYGVCMNIVQARDLQNAYLAWFGSPGVPMIAVTLTFKPKVGNRRLSEAIAQEAIRHYLRRINRISRGRKYGDRRPQLKTFAVREGGIGFDQKHLHYHLQIEVPMGSSASEFARFCLSEWSKLNWGSQSQLRASVDADIGWTAYILKLRDKPDFADAIDVMNCFL